jgi:hypothetical protein
VRDDAVAVRRSDPPERGRDPPPGLDGPERSLSNAGGGAGPTEGSTGGRGEDDDGVTVPLDLVCVRAHEVAARIGRAIGPARRHDCDAHPSGLTVWYDGRK